MQWSTHKQCRTRNFQGDLTNVKFVVMYGHNGPNIRRTKDKAKQEGK
jgi:hypothetical protein